MAMGSTVRVRPRPDGIEQRQATIPSPTLSIQTSALDEFPTPAELVRVAARHKLLLASVILPITMLAALYGYLAPARFNASAIVALAPVEATLPNMAPIPGQLVRDPSVLQTEIRVVTSPAVLGGVVDSLDLLSNPAFTDPPSVRASIMGFAQPVLQPIRDTARELVTQLRGYLNPDGAVSETPDPGFTRHDAILAIADKLRVEQSGQSYAISIDYRGTDPALAASIVNEIARGYVQHRLDEKRTVAQQAAAYLESRLIGLRREIQQSGADLEGYRERNALPVSIDDVAATSRLNDLKLKLLDVRGELGVAEARARALQDLQSSNNSAQLLRALDTATAQALQLEEVELDRRAADLLAKYGERHPMVLALRADQAVLRQKLRSEAQLNMVEAQRTLDLMHAKESGLIQEIAASEAKIAEEQRAMVGIVDLRQSADVNRRLHEELLTQQKLLIERQSLAQPDVQVIAEASPEIESASPPFVFFPVAGLVGSSALGLLLGLVRDRLDRRVRAARQLERLTGLAVLARLPKVKGLGMEGSARHLLARPDGAYAESLRQLLLALEVRRRDGSGLVCLMASPGEEEGRSTTVAALAILMRHAGRRVAAVDLNFRRPRLDLLLSDEDLNPALNDLLVSPSETRERRLAVLLRQPFAILPARPASEDMLLPLIEGDELAALIEDLRQKFDYVLLDTSPVLATSDACSLARHADVSVLVCRWMSTELGAVREAIGRLGSPDRAPVLGLVLNAIEPKAYRNQAASFGERAPVEGSYPGTDRG